MHSLDAASWLFMPGTKPRWFDKATGADALVLDLEDAVAPKVKDEARADVLDWLAQGGRAWLRINAFGTPWHADDVAAVADSPNVLGVVVPKAEDPDALGGLAEDLGAQKSVLALIETAVGVQNAAAIAATPGVCRLAFGALDYLLDIRAEDSSETLLVPRTALVIASRTANLPGPIDGVTVEVKDPSRVRADSVYARKLGFAGKLCIHPAQVDAVNRAFSPSQTDLDWAAAVLAAVEEHGDELAVFVVDGRMIDRPVIDRAHAIVAQARMREAQR